MRHYRISPIRAEEGKDIRRTPERRLLAAFLERAVRDIRAVSPEELSTDRKIDLAAYRTGRRRSEFWPENSREHHALAAIEWVEDRSDEPGGYLWVCSALDLPPQTVEQIRAQEGI